MTSRLLVSGLLLAVSACGGSSGPDVDGEVSACGGFIRERDVTEAELLDYCAAETFEWQYDAGAETLTVRNNRVLLNCCGSRGIGLEAFPGRYEVQEIDMPELDGGRCRCKCVYDFVVTAPGIPPGELHLQLLREVTDEDEVPRLIHEDWLRLGEGGGRTVISEEWVEDYCTQDLPE